MSSFSGIKLDQPEESQPNFSMTELPTSSSPPTLGAFGDYLDLIFIKVTD